MSISHKSQSPEVKREQKKSLYARIFSEMVQSLVADEPDIAQVFVTRVEFSKDGGTCYVYFSSYLGTTLEEKEKKYDTARQRLVLYKPSMRQALSKELAGRYVPNIRFMFDAQREKELRINALLDTVSSDISESEDSDSSQDG